jgi:diacylglycerol kinase (ATP)
VPRRGAAAPRPLPARPAPSGPGGGRGPWRSFAASFAFAWDGVVETALRQRNMRVHLVAGLLVCLVASGVALGVPEQLALLLCVFLVLSAEVANSALEALVDLVTRERHDLARAAKDAGAGAVLVLAAGSAAVFTAVVAHAWPALAASPAATLRQAAFGLPLALAAAALLAPRSRGRALDLALVGLGIALLGALATFTVSAMFTSLAALHFGVAAAVAARRRRERSAAHI